MSSRLLPNWINAYLDYTSDQESPESLHLWTALTLLASATRRQLYLELEFGRVYPNLYVIIVAESAKVRKSTAMDMGRDLFAEAFPTIRIMRDSMTSQGLIKSLNHKVQVVKGDKIEEELRSDVAIFADEVANLFSYERTRASQMVIFLTRAYGCPSIYDHTTVRDSTVRLHNLFPVLLGGTDPHNLKVLPEDAIGGLTGRLIWVIESVRRSNNPGWKRDNRKLAQRLLLREALIHDLQQINELKGEVTAAHEAMEIYDKWYFDLSTRDSKDPSSDAFYQRCHTTAQRIAMLLSLSESNNLIITTRQMERAINLIEHQLPEFKRVAMWSGNSQFEQWRAKAIHFVQKSPGGVATKRQLLKHMGIAADEFATKLLPTLVQDGTWTVHNLGPEVVVKLTKEGFGRVVTPPEAC